ncbi:MAG: hypothetical protein LBQ80_01675 [Clostridium sp.]|jgi:hypothetical protein|nr:hypothetical protein [Clostridium sp.]
MELIQKLFDAFNEWFQDFGTSYSWGDISIAELWGELLQKVSAVFAS